MKPLVHNPSFCSVIVVALMIPFAGCFYRPPDAPKAAPTPTSPPKVVLGHIADFTAPVVVRRSSELVWNDVSKDLPLYGYDAVQTSQKTTARIALTNKSQLQLGPDTLVILDPAALGKGSTYDRAIVRGGEVQGETGNELWIMTSAALIQMKSKKDGKPARVKVSVHEGKNMQVELKEGTGNIYRRSGENAAFQQGVPLVSEVPVVLPAPKADDHLGEDKGGWQAPPEPSPTAIPKRKAAKPKTVAPPPEQEPPAAQAAPEDQGPQLLSFNSPDDTTTNENISGITTEAIARVAKKHAKEVHYCFEATLIHDPEADGKVQIRFVINAKGRVKTARVESGTKDPDLNKCVLDRLFGWDFPKPRGGKDTEVSYPFTFRTVD